MSATLLGVLLALHAVTTPASAQPWTEGPVGLVAGLDPQTDRPYLQLASRGLPVFPTITVTCDGTARTFPLTRSEDTGRRRVAVYEVPLEAARAMLYARECRAFVPRHAFTLPPGHLWTVWAKLPEAPRILEGRVVDVVDGDTITVALGDRVETVRYIGIDAPELATRGRGAVPGGREAANANAALVARRTVRLELDTQERDVHGRLQAYVYAGERLVNAELLQQGYARLMTVPPNVRYAERFVKLEQEARDARRGLWGDPTERDAPATTLPAPDRPTAGGRRGVAPESAWACPATHPIKGDFTTRPGDRCIYHVPGGSLYRRARADRCYLSDQEARQDGCERSPQ